MSTINTNGINPSEWDGSQNNGNLSTDNFRDNIQAIKDALDEIPPETGNLTDAEVQQLQNINAVTISNTQWGYLGGQDQAVATTDAVTFSTVDTGQGANELYPMDQAVRTTDAVTFATVDTGQGANELYPMDQAVQTTDAVTFATVNTGQGANELYAMDQAVQTTDDVTFNTVDTSEVVNCQNTAVAWVNFDGTGTVSIRDDYNVDSITDNGVGDYTVNFTSALSDTNYAFSGASANNRILGWKNSSSPTVNGFAILCNSTSGSLNDIEYNSLSVFGGGV